jgi:hypothetical protein
LPPAEASLAERRFGFVPLSLEPLTTFPDPSSDLQKARPSLWGGRPQSSQLRDLYRTRWETATTAILGEAGPEPGDVTIEPGSPEAVYVARRALDATLASWERVTLHLSELIDCWDSSRTHPSLDDTDWHDKSPRQRAEVAREWRENLAELTQALDEGQTLRPMLYGLSPIDVPGEPLRQRIRALFDDHMPVQSHDRAVVASEGCHAAMALLHQFDVEDLRCSETMLAHARRTTRGTRYNANQLLGYPRESQAEAGLLALKKARSCGWASTMTTPADMRLLAQFDTCFGGWGAIFADCGKAYFFIHKHDLAACRFERAVVVINDD